MSNTVANRFLQWRKIHRLTQQDVADVLNVAYNTVYRWETGRSKISQKTAQKLEKIYGLAPTWLLYGEGQMTVPIRDETRSNARIIQPIGTIDLPLLSVTAAATFVENCAEIINGWQGEKFTVIKMPGTNYDKSIVIEIAGSSMLPRYPSHCKVMAKEIPEADWKYAYRVHAISLKSGMFVIKRIINNTGTVITLRSDNPDYPEEMIVQLADVQCMFKVLNIVYAEAE